MQTKKRQLFHVENGPMRTKNGYCVKAPLHQFFFCRSYHCEGLVSAATAYILRYFENVSKLSEDFLLLKYEDIKELINDDRLNVPSEESVCEAIYQWC